MARYTFDTAQPTPQTPPTPSISTQQTEGSAEETGSLPAKLPSMVPLSQVKSARLTLIRLYTDFPNCPSAALEGGLKEVKSVLRSVRECLPEVWSNYKSQGKPQTLVLSTQAHSLLTDKVTKQMLKNLILQLATVIACFKPALKPEKEQESPLKAEETTKKRPWSISNLSKIGENIAETDVELKKSLKIQLKEATQKLFRVNK